MLSDLPPRFRAKITVHPTGCWLWQGSADKAGYGSVKHGGRTTCAHLAVWDLLRGPHGAEELDHTCRVRCCVNPAHMEPVSHRENMRRGGGFAGLNAAKTHCKRGHEFTPENTVPHGKGNRNCRQCARDRVAARKGIPLSHPARTPMPAALRSSPLGLSHPATTPMPAALRSAMGERRVAVEKSAYAVRSERKGQLVELVDFLRQVRAEVQDGATLTQAVADGTLWGWRARQALSHSLGEPVATWDAQPGRTQLERLALVVRALAECGEEPRRGGWTVGGSRP